MTTGARPGLINLFNDFKDRVEVVSVYVREAHPGENYPHHMSAEQKLQQARDWVKLDKVPWTVAVDTLDGATHEAYGPLPNSQHIKLHDCQFLRTTWEGVYRFVKSSVPADKDREVFLKYIEGKTVGYSGMRKLMPAFSFEC